jgi:predicted HTH transcriptional regulator
MLTAQEVADSLRYGYELRGVEVKGPGPRTDKHLFAKVTRAALSMANLRDGGHVIIGIADDNVADMLPGLCDSDLSSWLAYDDIARKLANYADPPLRFDLDSVTLPGGANVAVMQVHEFADIPVLCAKDYLDVLRAGACYVRSRRVPETAEIPSAVEMRELLELATEKALRAYVERAENAGVILRSQSPASESADALFARQREADVW